ncbi:MAG: hypothetical protein ACKOZU_12015 [Planctomycetaceae bacterium]
MSVPGFQVPWTQPVDFSGEPADLFARLKSLGARSIVIGTGDGAVRRVSTGLDPVVVRAVFSRAGGESVPIDAF